MWPHLAGCLNDDDAVGGFQPFSCSHGSCLLQWQNQEEKVLPPPQGPVSVGVSGLSPVCACFTPGLQTQPRNMFNPPIWAQGCAKAAWRVASLLCRWAAATAGSGHPREPVFSPQHPWAMCLPSTGASPQAANSSATGLHSSSQVLPARRCWLSCKLPLFSY